ncbi:unnamed protein product [Zymoseptoria tritici ST99CH_1A5]|uniref:Uncharacterized protein n=1 Tax=Zymoseptoria tritici ST99CH_1A5 TaxID=1276529 RepID=A0A1Y6L4X8_ZYMTR|nr:unnamed protein product [Zymoseptoria tritici ST99CH_1A5]
MAAAVQAQQSLGSGKLDVLTSYRIDADGIATSSTGDQIPRSFRFRSLRSQVFPQHSRRKPASSGNVLPTMLPIPSSNTTTPSVCTSTTPPQSTCSPRSSPPRPTIEISRSNGCTLLTTAELKQKIHQSKTNDDTTLTQIPTDKRVPLPPTPTSPFFIMGNKPSSESEPPIPDDRSQRSVVRTNKPVSRKGSYNVFKRVDSRSPLPRDVTASVMSILHRDGQKRDEDFPDDDGAAIASNQPTYAVPERSDSRYPPTMSRPKLRSHSTTTMTEDKASQPLSASTTIRDFRALDGKQADGAQLDGADDDDSAEEMARLHSTSLSPTIPAPSPLPEDSPHKYGLRDKMDTPELPEPVKEISLPKARRKSSGLEIFNEAKTLQSAASFLNGLSTSRRRAESAAADTTDTANSGWTLGHPSRPSSARPSSAPRSGQHRDGEGRRKGHNFKSSGFAYTRPLSLTQIKCFRGHSRLLPSRNKHAPVECAVCHIDDDGDHFSCSWCAIRMCKYCRKDFAQRGMTALRERIKTAEMGGVDSGRASDESLAYEYELASKGCFE